MNKADNAASSRATDSLINYEVNIPLFFLIPGKALHMLSSGLFSVGDLFCY